eukprot:5630554-Prorocentrum_lima.AAC.1
MRPSAEKHWGDPRAAIKTRTLFGDDYLEMLWVQFLGVADEVLDDVPSDDVEMNIGGPRFPPEFPRSPPSTTGATGAPSERSLPETR